MKKPSGSGLCCTGVLALTFFGFFVPSLFSAETDVADPARKGIEQPAADSASPTNSQGELHLSQQAIDQLRREIEQSAARNAEAITSSLSLIEPTLARMHDRQMEAVQSSNRTILIVAGIFAAVGFLGLIFITLILVRAIGRFSEMAVMAGPRGHLLGPVQTAGALGTGEMMGARAGAAEQASQRFQGAIEQLQKRILELEHSAQADTAEASPARPPVTSFPASGKSNVQPAVATLNIQSLLPTPPAASNPGAEPAAPTSRAALLLGKGQALLNLDAAEPALQCFDEVLALEPNNAEALVKKGMTLEKLQDWEQALEYYNRAIAADGSMTVAHLYRGGVCNRLQRYREALESYEQALRTEKKSRAS